MSKTACLIISCICYVASAAQTKPSYPDINIPYKKFVLDNGLTLIVNEDHKLPIASFNIWYHVGSKNEKPGKTGFAHLFEHIMFTSTAHWSNFDEVMQTVGGGNNNGTTNANPVTGEKIAWWSSVHARNHEDWNMLFNAI